MNRALPAILVILPMAVLLAAAEESTADGLNFFETKIRPVLVERCYKCHSAEALRQNKLKGELNAGTNKLLIKIINASGPSGFYFSTRPDIPKNIQNILNLAADKRNDRQKQALLKWYSPRDSD